MLPPVLNLSAKAATMPMEPGLDSMACAGRRQAGSPYAPDIHRAEHVRNVGLSPVVQRRPAALMPGAVVFGPVVFGAGVLGGGGQGGGELDGRELAVRVDAVRVHAGGVDAVRVDAVRVLAGGQEPDAGSERLGTGQFEVGPFGEDFDVVDGQGDADITPPGVNAGEPADADPGHQGGDVEDDGQ